MEPPGAPGSDHGGEGRPGNSGSELIAWWFNPRTGEAAKAGTHKVPGTVTSDPPGAPAPGNDWILVLDDAAMKFNPPGAGIAR